MHFPVDSTSHLHKHTILHTIRTLAGILKLTTVALPPRPLGVISATTILPFGGGRTTSIGLKGWLEPPIHIFLLFF
jgi:hypothetical protein